MIREATINDLDKILEIEDKCFQYPWNKAQFQYEFNENPYATIYVIMQDDEIVGYFDLWIIFDRAELTNIAIEEKYQHLGYGSKIMEYIEKIAIQKGCESISLEVRVNNKKAIGLYEKFGYIKINVKKGYYQSSDGPVDGYLMMKGI